MATKMRAAQDRMEKKTEKVGAFALMFDGRFAGRVVLAYPTDGAGKLHCRVHFTAGPCGRMPALYGDASGYGYDKASAAVRKALRHESRKASCDEYRSVFSSLDVASFDAEIDAAEAVICAALEKRPDGYDWKTVVEAMGYGVEWVA